MKERTIQANGESIKLQVVRPANVKGDLPVFMFFHGGGWVLGDFPTHQRLIRDLVVGSGAVAVYVDYTPSPEAHYPTAINQPTPPPNGWPSMARKSAWTASARLWPATASAATWRQ